MMGFEGGVVEQDYYEAAKWFELVAKQGDAVAQTNLASLYLKGCGVAKDCNQATYYSSMT